MTSIKINIEAETIDDALAELRTAVAAIESGQSAVAPREIIEAGRTVARTTASRLTSPHSRLKTNNPTLAK